MSEDKTKLQLLAEWRKRPFLDKMLDDGESPNRCHKWCLENGFDISVPMLYKYASRRKKAIIADVPIMEAMDRKKPVKAIEGQEEDTEGLVDRKGRPNRRGRHKNTGRKEKPKRTNEARKEKLHSVEPERKVQTDLEMLDVVIQKGFQTLRDMEAVAPQVALKAVELKWKITGGKHMGVTTYGIEEIRLREAARENAILTVLLEYIPEEHHEEVIKKMEETTKSYYESVGLAEAYDNLEPTVEGEEVVND